MDNNENNFYGNVEQQVYNNTTINPSTYKLTIKREKSFVGCLVAFKIFIDGVKVGKIKNGQTVSFDVTPGNHIVSVNKKNPTEVIINSDTTADIAIFGGNNFGIVNINNGDTNLYYNSNSSDETVGKYNKTAISLLVVSVLLPIISVILFLLTSHKYVLQFWFYSIVIGYGIINIHGLKNIKETNNDAYKKSLIINIIAMLIALVSLIVTLCITTF